MKELPQNWATCKLEDLARDVSYGYTAKANKESGDARMLRITDIQDNSVDWDGVPYCRIGENEKQKYLLQKGDLLFARTGATVGKSLLLADIPYDSVYASYLIRVRFLNGLSEKYMSYFFRSNQYWDQIIEFSAGIGQPNVNGSKLKDLALPLAPLNEQKRIADKLDAVLARVDACRKKLERVPAILTQLRQSLLKAAITGALTKGWREERGLEMDWDEVELLDICESITDGDHQAPPKAESGIPFITISAMNTGELILSEATRFVPQSYYDELKSERRAAKGDLLYSVTGSIGIPALVDTEEPFVFQRHIAILKVDRGKAFAEFLWYRLMANDLLEYVTERATGTAQPTIPLKVLRSLRFNVPSLAEQQEIAQRLSRLFAFASNAEAKLHRANEAVERAVHSLLAKAFRGELVPQDPSDETASTLLGRVRAYKKEDNKMVKAPRTKRKQAPRQAERLTVELLRERIKELAANSLTAEELREAVEDTAHTYDQFRDVLFQLLGEKEPIIRQFFDKTERKMVFERVGL